MPQSQSRPGHGPQPMVRFRINSNGVEWFWNGHWQPTVSVEPITFRLANGRIPCHATIRVVEPRIMHNLQTEIEAVTSTYTDRPTFQDRLVNLITS